MKSINQLNLVPTVIPNLNILMNEFINLKLQKTELNEKEFKDKMFFNNKVSYTDNTKKAYCTPFGKKELNLFDEDLDAIKKLQINSYNWLKDKYKSGFIFKDDRSIFT